jgi:hypothetical protein
MGAGAFSNDIVMPQTRSRKAELVARCIAEPRAKLSSGSKVRTRDYFGRRQTSKNDAHAFNLLENEKDLCRAFSALQPGVNAVATTGIQRNCLIASQRWNKKLQHLAIHLDLNHARL